MPQGINDFDGAAKAKATKWLEEQGTTMSSEYNGPMTTEWLNQLERNIKARPDYLIEKEWILRLIPVVRAALAVNKAYGELENFAGLMYEGGKHPSPHSPEWAETLENELGELALLLQKEVTK